MIYREDTRAAVGPAPRAMINTVRWGAVWSGVVVGLGFMTLFTALWFALGYSSDVGFIRSNIEWWLGGTRIASLFVAGLVAGYVCGVRGPLAGFLNACTTWALATTVGAAVGLGIAANTLHTTSSLTTINAQIPSHDLWIGFAAIVIGLAAATLGGLAGGAMTKVTAYPMTQVRGDYPEERVVQPRDTEVIDAGRHRAL